MHRGILGCISSPLLCTDYIHACLIPLDMLCSQTMCQKLFLCAFTIVINSKRGGALKAGVLVVWYSHIVQALGNVVPRKLGGTKPKAHGYQSNARYNSIENDDGTI